LKVSCLCDVAEAGQLEVQPLRTEVREEASDGLRTPDWHDGDALSVKIAAALTSESLDRDLVADPFNEHDGARVDAGDQGRLSVRRWIRSRGVLHDSIVAIKRR
jgi:hypothetical protein